MARTRFVTIIIAAMALLAAFALVVGCSSSSSSSAGAAASTASASAASTEKTLESYFKENLAEWETAVAQIKEKAGDTMDVDMTLSGNRISQIMTYNVTYSDEAVAQLKTRFENAAENLKANTTAQIKTMEEKLGVKGITWYFEYRNGDGKPIASFEYGAEG